MAPNREQPASMKKSRIIPIVADPGDALAPALRAPVRAAIAQHRDRPGALLPVLHAVQDAVGYVPKEAVPLIAQALNLSRAEVHGVVSFYHTFRQQPPGRHVLQLCRAEACQAVGAGALEAHARHRLGIDYHGTTADGALTLEPVYCLGNCALGPSMTVDGQLLGRVTPQRFDTLVEGLRGGA